MEMKKYWIASMKATKKSEGTIENYVNNVDRCLTYVKKPATEVTYLDLLEWSASLNGLSSSTICTKIAAVKSYFEFLVDADVIEKNPADKLKSPKIQNKEKLPLTADEVKSMLRACSNHRNRAIVTTLVQTGMRISELTNMTLDQYNNRIGNTVVITGKGNKMRNIVMSDGTIDKIDRYVKYQRKNGECDRLFVSNYGTPMCDDSIIKTLRILARDAGVADWEKRDITPHTLRHTFATLQSESGTPIEVIAEMMGHSSVLTTAKVYINVGTSRVESAFVKNLI